MTRMSKLGTERTTALELELPIKPQKDHVHLLALFLLARHDRKDDGANSELSTMLLLVGRDLQMEYAVCRTVSFCIDNSRHSTTIAAIMCHKSKKLNKCCVMRVTE